MFALVSVIMRSKYIEKEHCELKILKMMIHCHNSNKFRRSKEKMNAYCLYETDDIDTYSLRNHNHILNKK